MKFKTTAKAVRQNYGTILRVWYCELQRLLRDERPVAYSAGKTYGWNFDLYDIDGVAICTGYRGMPGVDVPYSIVKKFEEASKNIEGYDCKAKEEQKELVRGFIAEAVNAIEAAKASKRSKKAKV